MTVAVAKRRITWRAIRRAGVACIGIIFVGVSAILLYEWFTALAPKPGRILMYQTPLTTFVPGRSFSPGHPSLEISMEQFEKESVGREFVVYYPKEWQDGFADRIMSHNTIVAGLPAVYHMKRPGSDIYQFAYLKVPYSDTMSGYNTRTAFDQDAKAFYPIVVGSTYAMLIFGTIFLIIGILVLLSAFVLLCEEYDFDPFNYISKRFSR